MNNLCRDDATAILIGTAGTARRLEKQFALLPMEQQPRVLGWIDIASTSPGECSNAEDGPRSPNLGCCDDLDTLVEQHCPDLALISMPAAMGDLITAIRTQLRKLGCADRFMPTLEDQIAGIGPRTHLDVDLQELIGRQPRQVDQQAMQRVISGRRVLITGAGGSIGSELARIAAGLNPEVLICMDRSENALFEIDRQIARFHPEINRHAVLHDVVDVDGTRAILERHQPEIIFHAAAHKHVPMMEDHPKAAVDNNVLGTRSVADAADALGVKRFVMISTDKAVHPRSVMGATKRLAELYVQWKDVRSSTDFTIVRFGNVLGSSGSVLETWQQQLRDGGPLTVTDPQMTRYFMTIPEAASLVIQAAGLKDELDDDNGAVYVLDMGEPIRIVDLAKQFITLHGLQPLIRLPAEHSRGSASEEYAISEQHIGTVPIVFTGVRPGEKLHEDLAFDAEVMQQTPHPSIHCWRLAVPDKEFVQEMLQSLEMIRFTHDIQGTAREIHRLVRAGEQRRIDAQPAAPQAVA